MKNKILRISSLACGVITTITLLTLAIYQLVNLVTFQVGIPKISNVSNLELFFIGIVLFSTFVAMSIFKTDAVKSRDDLVLSEFYLAKKRKAKIAILMICVTIFFTV